MSIRVRCRSCCRHFRSMAARPGEYRSPIGGRCGGADTDMARVRANGIDIEYETLGDPKHPAILLIMGLGAQLIHWPDALCRGLVARGFHVVRFDNRDSGLSTSLDSWSRPDLAAVVGQVMRAERADVPYRLDDMAADAVGLLDA